MKILVAEGSVVLRERLVSTLSEVAGVEAVEQARDASETLEAISHFNPDVVVLDTQMRGGNGFELLEYTRRHRPSTVLIILSDQPYQQYRKKCLESGAAFFFSKASGLKLLVGVVKDLAVASSRFTVPEEGG